MRRIPNSLFFVCIFMSLSGPGCGYSLRNTRNVLGETEGIHRIYVAPVTNDTYKGGAENVVYNALLRALAASGKIRLVNSPSQADAVLYGKITEADFTYTVLSQANALTPSTVAQSSQFVTNNTLIATEYQATLGCNFILQRAGNTPPGKKALLWNSAFTRNKLFQANNQLGVAGATSALVNESEFDRALGDIARNMMVDVDDSMLSMF